MTFDALLTIVFILFFVVGPLLRRLGGGQQPPQERGGQGSPRPRPEAQEAGEVEGPLARRLEEARKRVLEAMGEGDQPGPESTPEPPRQQPAPRPPKRQPELDWQSVSGPTESFIQRRERKVRSEKPAVTRGQGALRKTRDAARAPARLRAERGFAIHRRGIVNGMIWHEILGEPVAKRGTRRQTSRLRSR